MEPCNNPPQPPPRTTPPTRQAAGSASATLRSSGRCGIAGVGADAALAVQIGRIPMETVATALGASEAAARRYVNG
ncbi:hypothetical protein GCM10010425_83770 [Streptomyces spororaveus]